MGGHQAPQAISPHVSILTGCQDKPYAVGLAASLAKQGVHVEVVGDIGIDHPALHDSGDVALITIPTPSEVVSKPAKVRMLLLMYARLLAHPFTSKAPIFHVLWNN